MDRTTRLWIILPVGAALLAATVVISFVLLRGGGIDGDPAGTTACRNLAAWIRGDVSDPKTGKPEAKAIMSGALADEAKDSTTPAIKAAAGEDLMADPSFGGLLQGYGGPDSLRFANLRALHGACVAAGMKMPAYAEPA